MIAELGHAALWLAAALCLAQLGFAIADWRLTHSASRVAAMRPLAVAQGLLTVLAFGCLITVFVHSDMSVKLVASHSHSAKPLLYKISGAWGNHEGSMLLWVMVLSLSGGALAWLARRLDPRVLSATLGSQAALGLGFFTFLLLASNPFERLNPSAIEGRGLNPLLQDPGLAFHPPTLYLGYVGLSVAFSIAIAGMLTDRVGPALGRAMRPWVLGSWILLTVGIAAGSYWAYYELGWGGYWFWDPVENASLMPWIAASALLHSVGVLSARGALRAWTMMLALVAFSMSMAGTFLVRSGVLTSVHAFAVDPTRGSYILALLALYVGGGLALFGVTIAKVKEGDRFDLKSREGALVANNLLLSIILALVFIGTLYPLAAEAMGSRVSVGPPYFNMVIGPFALLLALLLFIGPMLRWRRDKRPLPKITVAALLVSLGMLIGTFIVGLDMSWLSRLGLTLAVGLFVASFGPLAGRKLWRTPLTIWGMVIAHAGIAVLLAGMASEASFTQERLARAEVGDTLEVGPWTVRFEQVAPVVGDNWTAVEATLLASKGDGVKVLTPQSRTFSSPPTVTSEAALATRWNGQLYAVLGEGSEQEGWQLRLWWKPLVTLIWYGALMIALGGLVALLGRTIGERRRAKRIKEPGAW